MTSSVSREAMTSPTYEVASILLQNLTMAAITATTTTAIPYTTATTNTTNKNNTSALCFLDNSTTKATERAADTTETRGGGFFLTTLDPEAWTSTANTSPPLLLPPSSSSSSSTSTVVLMELILQPLVLALGTLGNASVLVVMACARGAGGPKVWDPSTSVLLTALALSDQLVLTAGLLPSWAGLLTGFYVWNAHDVLCKGVFWLLETVAKLSSWLLVALTFLRMTAVLWPHRVHLLCTRGRSLALTVGLALFFAALHWQYLDALRLQPIGDAYVCRYDPAELAYMKYVDLLLFNTLPFCCLVVSNGVLAWKLVASATSGLAQTTSSSARAQTVKDSAASRRQKRASSTTVTVMVISLAFFCLTLPICVRNIMSFLDSGGDGAGVDWALFTVIAVNLSYCNSAVNFYLYCLTGAKFRRKFFALICCRCSRN